MEDAWAGSTSQKAARAEGYAEKREEKAVNPWLPVVLGAVVLWYFVGKSSQLSPNYHLSDLTTTGTGLENTPDQAAIENLRRLANDILEPLQARTPFLITSGYRSEAVNSHPSVNGAQNSHHLEGNAVDLVPLQLTPEELSALVVQLELPVDENLTYDKHIHLSNA